ncbi:MAG: DUF1648 domain-containing protein [Bacteroidetes bacterium]|nr:MAG: DUF1648 domain-containing protein [Bacteroidota bacterium]
MSFEERPRIKPEWQQVDWFLEGVAGLGMLLLLLLPATYYSELPDMIPTHFNARGEADDYGSKASIWILPLIGAALYGFLTSLNRYPHVFNYSVKITPDNAETQYRLAIRMLRGLKLFMLFLFTYICWGTIRGALAGDPGLSSWFVWLTFGGIAVMLIWYLISATRAK